MKKINQPKMKNKLDQRFIDKSVQIRKEFLKSVKVAMDSQEIVSIYLSELNDLKEDLDNVQDTDDFIKKINIIEQKIQLVEKEMSYHLKKREFLEQEEKQLCELVLERYPDITEDEIKEQILPHIENIKI
jgi:hypothetical protein